MMMPSESVLGVCVCVCVCVCVQGFKLKHILTNLTLTGRLFCVCCKAGKPQGCVLF